MWTIIFMRDEFESKGKFHVCMEILTGSYAKDINLNLKIFLIFF